MPKSSIRLGARLTVGEPKPLAMGENDRYGFARRRDPNLTGESSMLPIDEEGVAARLECGVSWCYKADAREK